MLIRYRRNERPSSFLLSRDSKFVFLFLLASLFFCQQATAERRFVGPDGQVLPFANDDEVLEFLRNAEVVSYERVGSGVNNPWKLLMERDGIRAHAVFRDVCIEKDRIRLKEGLKIDFRDDAVFEAAAYHLGRLLGISNIPPVVRRTLMESDGTLQLWLEGVMTEGDRVEQDVRPTDLEEFQRWQAQTHLMHAFDLLIYNEDRNHGNVLYDQEWGLWMIDHTRSFRRFRRLFDPKKVWRIETNFLKRLRQVDKAEVKEVLSSYLKPAEVRGVLARIDLLIDHAEKLIRERGADRALVTLPERETSTVQPAASPQTNQNRELARVLVPRSPGSLLWPGHPCPGFPVQAPLGK